MLNKKRVLLVDDHPIIRIGLARILEDEKEVEIIGEAVDGLEAVSKALELKPDLIIMDLYMPQSNGIQSMLAIKKELPEVKVLICSISERDEDLFEALRLGAHGYILKGASGAEVIDAVKRTASGESVLSPSLANRLVSEFRRKKQPDNVALSQREQEVLKMVGDGQTNKEIATDLFISSNTVRSHLQRVLDKLHLKNRATAIAYVNRQIKADSCLMAYSPSSCV